MFAILKTPSSGFFSTQGVLASRNYLSPACEAFGKTKIQWTFKLIQPRRMGHSNSSEKKPVSEFREEYGSQGLDESNMPRSPFDQFSKWFNEAVEAKVPEPNAMALATVGADGRPAARMVLLKGVDEGGFVWYTNYESRKGQHLAANPWAALTFWWAAQERSVRVEGRAAPVPPAESDAYFGSRPRGSQLGAMASDQSKPISSRAELENKLKDLEAALGEGGDGAAPPPPPPPPRRPAHWGGYRLVPHRVEFWQGRANRLHDRVVYTRELPPSGGEREEGASELGALWMMERLQP